MKTEHNRSISVLMIACLLLVPLPNALARDNAQVSSLLSLVEKAVNAGDEIALRKLFAQGASPKLDWIKSTGSLYGKGNRWKARLLELPGSENKTGDSYVGISTTLSCESKGDHLYHLVAASGGPRLGAEVPETDTGGYRVRDHRLSVRFNIKESRVAVVDNALVEPQTDAGKSPILRLNSVYTVSSVKRGNQSVSFHQAGGFLALPAQTTATRYAINFSGSASTVTDYIKPDHAALTAYWYVHTGRMPSTSSVSITVPSGWTAIGQGEPTGKTVKGTEVTYGWSNSLPVCYLTVAAGKYVISTSKINNVEVSAFLLNTNERRAQNAIETAGYAIKWFSANFSAFPYKRYAVVESAVFPAALECYSFTLVNKGLMPTAIVHEVSHTWWGGVVPNTYTRSLWNESFAEYSDALYRRLNNKPSSNEFGASMLVGMTGPLMRTRSLMQACDALDNVDSAVGYGKGCLVLENLENMLGTNKMLAAMRRFIQDHKLGEDADWPDFVNAVEETSGDDWRGYFTNWLNGTDLPSLRFAGVAANNVDGKWVVEGYVEQDKPAYWFSLPITIKTESIDINKTMAVKNEKTPFRFTLPTRPTKISLDPDSLLYRKQYGSTDTPNLAALQTSGDPLLLVYASSEVNDNSQAIIANLKKQAVDAASFASITIKPDIQLTESDIANFNLLLVGNPASFKLPDDLLTGAIPKVANGSLVYRDKEWNDDGCWAFAVVKHPKRANGLMALAVAPRIDMLANFGKQGAMDNSHSLFVMRKDGSILYSEQSATPDPTIVDYDAAR